MKIQKIFDIILKFKKKKIYAFNYIQRSFNIYFIYFKISTKHPIKAHFILSSQLTFSGLKRVYYMKFIINNSIEFYILYLNLLFISNIHFLTYFFSSLP